MAGDPKEDKEFMAALDKIESIPHKELSQEVYERACEVFGNFIIELPKWCRTRGKQGHGKSGK